MNDTTLNQIEKVIRDIKEVELCNDVYNTSTVNIINDIDMISKQVINDLFSSKVYG